MKRSIILGLHIGFWLCYLILSIVLLYLSLKDAENAQVDKATVRAVYFAVIPSIISYYSFYFLVFPQVRLKKFTVAVISSLIIAVGASLVGTILIYFFLGSESLTEANESIGVGIVFISILSLVVGTVALVTKGFVTWFEELKLKEELKQRNHEIEMALIKSQLDPHFLFNTLNNIDILILKDADRASDYLNKLSDIIRFMLFETRTDKIALTKEIEYIEKYISLQRIRTANSNYINFNVTGSPIGRTIAPMVFLPFIENAFKHSTNKKLDNAINVNIQIDNISIQLECVNKFDLNRKPQDGQGGLGNVLMERRLSLIYPENHILKVLKGEEEYRVELTINQ